MLGRAVPVPVPRTGKKVDAGAQENNRETRARRRRAAAAHMARHPATASAQGGVRAPRSRAAWQTLPINRTGAGATAGGGADLGRICAAMAFVRPLGARRTRGPFGSSDRRDRQEAAHPMTRSTAFLFASRFLHALGRNSGREGVLTHAVPVRCDTGEHASKHARHYTHQVNCMLRATAKRL